jgi:protein SCO1/2
MEPLPLSAASSEDAFAGCVDALAAAPDACRRLIELLREDHPVYDQRGGATVALMRGWVLVALARTGVSDEALRFVLEELDTGIDPYPVAAAARALRSYPHPGAALAPFVMRALDRIRYHDDPVCFDAYGEYGTAASATSPVRELLATAAWLGAQARDVLPQLEALASARGLAREAKADAARAVAAIRRAIDSGTGDESCCDLPPGLAGFWRPRTDRRGSRSIESLPFEDHDGATVTFKDVFDGHPTIVVFFYTRCDNPLKCSLTVTKLARVQTLLTERGLDGRIHTAAITYDPAFDSAKRLATYGRDRGVRMDARHRLLRAREGMTALRAHFELGVSFIESLVNRHRVEAYILDAHGRIAASFERLLWDEQAVVDRAIAMLTETEAAHPPAAARADDPAPLRRSVAPLTGVVASVGIAFFPKCPVCWATYLSLFGVAGLEQIPLPSWLQPVLLVALLINVASAWLRARVTRRIVAPLLVTIGAAAILVSGSAFGWEALGPWGVALVAAGSVLSALQTRRPGRGDERQARIPASAPLPRQVTLTASGRPS